MTVTLPEKVREGYSCWTKDYCLRHCEGYKVYGPDGMLGYVEQVWLTPDEDAVEALVVRGTDYEKFSVPGELVEDIDPAADCLWITEAGE